MAKKILLQPENFELETNTVWSFPNRGKWATHDAKWRGNWSPYIPRNVIMRYSVEGDTVLDQFVGGGTTAVEAKLTKRNFIGVDINPVAIERSTEKCNFEYDSPSKITFTHWTATFEQLKYPVTIDGQYVTTYYMEHMFAFSILLQ